MSEPIDVESTAIARREPQRAPMLRIDTIERMGRAIAMSGLFGIKTEAQAVALMLIAQAEGRHPASAAQDYNIIQGRPALKADAMLARFQSDGGVVEWQEMTDQRVAGLFSHPTKCPKPVMIDWDMARAEQAGLKGKDNYKKYPRQMLRARVISEGVRATDPAACCGMYTPEEVNEFEPQAPAAAPAATPAPTPKQAEHDAIADEVADAFDGQREEPPADEAPESRAASTLGDFPMPACPVCAGPMWDNRADRASDKAGLADGSRTKSARPAAKCRSKECGGTIWSERQALVQARIQQAKAIGDNAWLHALADRMTSMGIRDAGKWLTAKLDDAAMDDLVDYVSG